MTFDPEVCVNEQRFWSTIERSSEKGAIAATTDHGAGLRRLALTDADKEMRDLFVSWCKEDGLKVTIDPMGSIFARRPGKNNELPPVLIGSHLDTQETGGRYDGVVGVLGALEVIRTLNDLGHTTRRPVEIVNWTNEEGGRFPPPMVASGCFAGVYDIDWAHDIASDDGTRLGDELQRIGYLGSESMDRRLVHAYLELHIEQGPVLDREQIDIGVVTHGFSVHGFRIAFHGETGHAGTQPMGLRRNALVAASRLATIIDDIGQHYSDAGAMATVARINAFPNKSGIVASFAELVGDVRHSDAVIASEMANQVLVAAEAAAARANCEVEMRERWDWGGDIFDRDMVDLIRSTAELVGASHRDIASQAGHDAYFMARICPTAMIFTPCRDGVTHHPDEYATLDRTAPGVNVLLHATRSLADQ